MLVYRLGSEKYIKDLSGTGARLHGGRWNHKGTAILYTSEHCSLALLEVIVNTSKKLIPDDYHLLKLTIPDEITTKSISRDELPQNWRQYPAPDTLADIGSSWAAANETAILSVPSVLVPDEMNLLLNPAHPDAQSISIESVSPFELDSRF